MSNIVSELPPQQHHTLALTDHHYLDARGMPKRHQTHRHIRALAPIVSIPYRFNTPELSVEGLEGCRAGKVYEAAPGIYTVDLELDEPLDTGEEATLEHLTLFHYQKRPEPVFNRAVGARAVDLDIHVVFDGSYPPINVWQSNWSGYQPGSAIIAEQLIIPKSLPADLENGLGVHLSRPGLQDAVIGFRWEWPD